MLSSSLKKQATLKESVLMVIMALAMCYLLHSLVYAPKKAATQKIQEQLTKIEDEIKREKIVIQEMKSKQVKVEDETVKQLKSTMAISPVVQMIQKTRTQAFGNISEFIFTISKSEFRSSLSFQSLNHSEEQKNDGYKSTVFHLVVTGQFVRMINFLEKIEDLTALIAIDAVKLSANNTNDLVTLDLTGTFFQMEDDNV